MGVGDLRGRVGRGRGREGEGEGRERGRGGEERREWSICVPYWTDWTKQITKYGQAPESW